MGGPLAGFTPLVITPDIGQAPWNDIRPHILGNGRIARVGLLRHGTSGGRASFALAIELDGGGVIIGETTWRLMNSAMRALAASPVASEEDPG